MKSSRPNSGMSMTSSSFLQSVNSLNASRCSRGQSSRAGHSTGFSTFKPKNESIMSSPGRKSTKSIDETEYIPNQNSLKLRKADTYNAKSISNSWIDLNLSCQNKKEKDNMNN